MTGISLGIMQPDPRPVIYEGWCGNCLRAVRGVGPGVVGETKTIFVQCGDCGQQFHIESTARELDS